MMMGITLRGRWLRSESIGIIRGIVHESCDIVRGEYELELCTTYIRFGMKQVGVSKIRNVISASGRGVGWWMWGERERATSVSGLVGCLFGLRGRGCQTIRTKEQR